MSSNVAPPVHFSNAWHQGEVAEEVGKEWPLRGIKLNVPGINFPPRESFIFSFLAFCPPSWVVPGEISLPIPRNGREEEIWSSPERPKTFFSLERSMGKGGSFRHLFPPSSKQINFVWRGRRRLGGILAILVILGISPRLVKLSSI